MALCVAALEIRMKLVEKHAVVYAEIAFKLTYGIHDWGVGGWGFRARVIFSYINLQSPRTQSEPWLGGPCSPACQNR